ncbi:hypothetical protein DPSP01_005446 [Paraphaeosphaeria sporulosa]
MPTPAATTGVAWHPSLTSEDDRTWVQDLVERHREHSLVYAWSEACEKLIGSCWQIPVWTHVQVMKGRHGNARDQHASFRLWVAPAVPGYTAMWKHWCSVHLRESGWETWVMAGSRGKHSLAMRPRSGSVGFEDVAFKMVLGASLTYTQTSASTGPGPGHRSDR